MKKTVLLPLVGMLAMALVTTGCMRKTTEEKANDISSHLAKTLDMTDVQRRKVDIIKNDILNKRTEIYNKQMMDQVQYELTSQLHSEKFDPAQFEDFKDKTLDKQDEFISYLGEKFAELHSMLSPPQRERLVQDIEKNKDKWFGDK